MQGSTADDERIIDTVVRPEDAEKQGQRTTVEP